MKIKSLLTLLLIIVIGACAGTQTGQVIDTQSYQESKSPVQVAKEYGYFDFDAYDAQGNLIWSEHNVPNNLADEGEEYFLDVTLRNATEQPNFCLRLFNDTPVETDTLAALTGEPSANGYAGQTVEQNSTGWPTLALDSGDYMATSSQETFSASGGSWGPVTYAVLTTKSGAACDNTGNVLVSYAALSQSRTLNDGETLKITYKIKLQ